MNPRASFYRNGTGFEQKNAKGAKIKSSFLRDLCDLLLKK
jgi:hypothetical protein